MIDDRMTRPASSAAHRRAVRAYQRRHRDAGLCLLCSRPIAAESARLCLHHLRLQRLRSLARYYQRQGRPVPPRVARRLGRAA